MSHRHYTQAGYPWTHYAHITLVSQTLHTGTTQTHYSLITLVSHRHYTGRSPRHIMRTHYTQTCQTHYSHKDRSHTIMSHRFHTPAYTGHVTHLRHMMHIKHKHIIHSHGTHTHTLHTGSQWDLTRPVVVGGSSLLTVTLKVVSPLGCKLRVPSGANGFRQYL